MAVTKFAPYRQSRDYYVQHYWDDNQSYFLGWAADATRFVPAHEVEDGDHDANEPEWYKEVYSEV